MNKIKAILRIICSKHFYLITANRRLQCEQIKSKNSDNYTIASFINLYWEFFYRTIYNSKNNE